MGKPLSAAHKRHKSEAHKRRHAGGSGIAAAVRSTKSNATAQRWQKRIGTRGEVIYDPRTKTYHIEMFKKRKKK